MSTQVTKTDNGFTIKSRASWTFQEFAIVAFFWLVFAGVGGYAAATALDSIPLAITTAIVGALLGIFVLFTAAKRKNQSTIHATLEGDVLNVWMVKPLTHKWANKLDKASNKLDLSTWHHTEFFEALGTPALKLVGSKAVHIPQRLAEVDEIRKTLRSYAKADDAATMTYLHPNHGTDFEYYLTTGEIRWHVTDDAKDTPDIPSVKKASEKRATRRERVLAAAEAAKASEETPEEEHPETIVVRAITYGDYELLSAADEVDRAVAESERKADEDAANRARGENNSTDVGGLLLGGGTTSRSVNIDL